LRFTDLTWSAPEKLPRSLEILHLVCWLIVGLCLPLVCIRVTYLKSAVTQRPLPNPTTLSSMDVVVGLLVGVVSAAVLLSFRSAIANVVTHPEATNAISPFDELSTKLGVRRRFQRATVQHRVAEFLPGYFEAVEQNPPTQSGQLGVAQPGQNLETSNQVLRPGHGSLAALFVVTLIVYAILYYGARFEFWLPETASLPVLFYAVFLILIASLASSGAAFFLDLYRVPVLGIFLIGWFVASRVYQRDHFYGLLPLDNRPVAANATEPEAGGSQNAPATSTPQTQPPDLVSVFEGWKSQQPPRFPEASDKKRTLVVVAAEGGGIQSAAWTARVLTGLHQKCPNFTKSVGIVSGVSGGSVGLLFYLAKYDDLQNNGATAIDSIREAASTSGLEAIGGGLLGPDFLRSVVPFDFLAPDDLVDRGLALERVWGRQLQRLRGKVDRQTLRGLVDDIQRGKLPIPIFNSTRADTGQRFVLSPIQQGPPPQKPTDGEEFVRLFPVSDIELTTAARLSSTFSYASPICRPEWILSGNQRAHGDTALMADGGYADNDGVVSALAAVNRLTSGLKSPPFDRVLVVRILGFPDREGADRPYNDQHISDCIETSTRPASLASNPVIGPVIVLNEARGSSQAERGRLELNALVASSAAKPVPIASVDFVFTSSGVSPPLSWKLSLQEQENIETSWEGILQLQAPKGVTNPFKAKVFGNLTLDQLF
jgi:hypothetical protein